MQYNLATAHAIRGEYDKAMANLVEVWYSSLLFVLKMKKNENDIVNTSTNNEHEHLSATDKKPQPHNSTMTNVSLTLRVLSMDFLILTSKLRWFMNTNIIKQT